jgi:SPP1 family phage portal protein
MKIEKLKELTSKPDEKLIEAIDREVADRSDEFDLYDRQYDVTKHDVFDKTKRKDKPIKDKDGNIVDMKPVNRIGIPLQKIITSTASAFLCGNPIKLVSTPKEKSTEETLLKGVEKVWEDNKLDYKGMDIAEKMMSETEVAELWYMEALEEDSIDYWSETGITGKFKPRMKVLARSLGDKLKPVFNPSGNLIAFGRGYKLTNDGETEEHFDIYTDKFFYHGRKIKQGEWLIDAPVPNMVGKIPVIYFSQPSTEWADVQTSIDRLENLFSRHAETNDYSGAPIFFSSGNIGSMPDKEADGKAIQGEQGADAKFLSWDHAPESIKLEIDNLFNVVYSCTFTPDISFGALKGVGQTSGYAMECMFMGAHLKAAKKAGIFGEGIQRRINYLKAAIATIDLNLTKAKSLSIKPQFEFYLPKDMKGLVDMLTTAVAGKIMAKETAIEQLGYADATEEMKRIEKEANSAGALADVMNTQL